MACSRPERGIGGGYSRDFKDAGATSPVYCRAQRLAQAPGRGGTVSISRRAEIDLTSSSDNAALRAAKQKLETQSSTSFDKSLRTSHLSQDRVVQQLSREKQELAASLEGMNDRINLARQKQARSEAHAAECMQELNKVRQLNAEVDRRNVGRLRNLLFPLTTRRFPSRTR
jgi:hypothetical protein